MQNGEAETFLAHVRKDSSGGWVTHSLAAHLREVSRIAGEFADAFQSSDWAAVAGVWHDLGKYSSEFQHYIQAASGYNEQAHLEGSGANRVDHSTAGAIHAVRRFGETGRILAYLIAGHHAGLPDWHAADTGGACLSARLQQFALLDRIPVKSIPIQIRERAMPTKMACGGSDGFHLWVRMLFSCLVDADFLDTEAFMDASRMEMRQGFSTLTAFFAAFDRYMEKKQADLKARGLADSTINRIRAEILAQCRSSAQMEPGAFSLTVPTGGGKTLSSLAFALEHAVKHGKRRIVFAIPYTSIIEQTADIFRAVFGAENVIEHHSNFDVDRETPKSRLASENWDAPLIVTTNVQLFESLFAARTSRCRKLHNLVGSIIVLDEAQLLPPEFLQPILDTLNLLTRHYCVTVLLSTATQPSHSTV
ncbi:MAG: CRISPR-associated endonuclease Cas3'', partial [Burkholderiaceae bacterium]